MAYLISCLCGSAAQEIQLESTDSVLDLCHCTSCRAITGQLCSSYHRLIVPPRKLDGLREYQQSEGISRYFCKTCGAHVFLHLDHQDQYLVASGLIVENPPQCSSIRHWNIDHTRDGGLSSFIPGEAIAPASGPYWLHAQRYAQDGQDPALPRREMLLADLGATAASDSERQCRLQAVCHCGGVDFSVTPPDSSSRDASSPWPDLLVPYHSTSSENAEDVKWWLQAKETKFLAGTCACRTCRLASGFPIQTWAFIPKSNITTDQSTTMQRYESSPGVYREFCNCCGATIFWHCQERPKIIDVSVGLLRAESGARAQEWLEWATGRVSFTEMALDKFLIQRLEAGLVGSTSDTPLEEH